MIQGFAEFLYCTWKILAHAYIHHNSYVKLSESTLILYNSMSWIATIIQNGCVITEVLEK